MRAASKPPERYRLEDQVLLGEQEAAGFVVHEASPEPVTGGGQPVTAPFRDRDHPLESCLRLV